MPLIACSFNFYVERSIEHNAKEVGNKTSSVLKSLVMSKTVDSDTGNTIDDIMSQTKNNTIISVTNGKNLNNWGVNGKIDISGFDRDQFFVASGAGILTKEVNNKKSMNKTLGYAKQINSITVISNSNLNSLINSSVLQKPIMTFLTTLQNNLKKSPESMKLICHFLNNYSEQFLPAISQLLNNLVTGDWSQGHGVPNDIKDLSTFISEWKDINGQPYSQWNQNETWNITSNIGHQVQNWTPEAYSLYRSGTLINHLFWQIGNDNKQVEPQYLGQIISKNIDGLTINTDQLIKELTPYLQNILNNPTYLITIIEAIIPIIKKWILEMSNINLGIKNLIFSYDKTSNSSSGTFNLLKVINTIKAIIHNPDQLTNIIKKILGVTTNNFDTFTYDIMVKIGNILIYKNHKKSILQLNPLSFSKINISWEKVKHFRSTDYEKIIY